MKRSSLILGACLLSSVSFGQILHGTKKTFTLDDTLRGTITPERAWWDLMRYDLSVDVDIDNKFFRGSNVISYKALSPGKVMQIDLQEPLSITSVVQGEKSLKFTKKELTRIS